MKESSSGSIRSRGANHPQRLRQRGRRTRGPNPHDAAFDDTGEILVVDNAAGTGGVGALFRVASTGDRTIVSDFDSPAQGPAGARPQGLAPFSIIGQPTAPSDHTVSLKSPKAAGAGDTISLKDTTKNAGAGAAGATITRYYFSTNKMLDAADVQLGGRAVPPLAAGARSKGRRPRSSFPLRHRPANISSSPEPTRGPKRSRARPTTSW